MRIAVSIEISKYNAVWKILKNGKAEQVMEDLPELIGECKILGDILKRFKVDDIGEGGIYELKEPTYGDIDKLRRSISKRLFRTPDRKTLVFYTFSCHGIQQWG